MDEFTAYSQYVEQSPSTRRAWIEIWETYWQTEQGWVTLHPEGVDRNMKQILWIRPSGVSLSTWRARVESKS